MQNCRAEKIELYAGEKAPEQAHCLQGKVVQLMEESDRVRAVVNVGFLLTVLLKREKYDSLRPGISDTVAVSIAEDAVTLSN